MNGVESSAGRRLSSLAARSSGVLLWLTLVIGAVGRLESQQPPLIELFSHLATVQGPESIAAGELVRLPLQAAIVELCAADFSDLRIAAGDEFLPYVLDGGDSWADRELLREARLLAFESRQLSTSGDVAMPSAESRVREIMRLTPPPPGRGWWLVASTDRPSFFRTVEIWEGDPGSPDAVLRSAGQSVFRLRQPLRESLRVEVGRIESGQAPLTVVLEGDGPAVQPHWQWARSADPQPVDSEVRSHFVLEPRGGETLAFSRPPAVLPEALRIATAEPLLRAVVRVWEQDFESSGDRLLGAATIFRTGRDGQENLEIPLNGTPRRGWLRLTFDGSDQPPSFDFELHALANQPQLVFAWPEAGEAPTLLFGGGRVRPADSGLEELKRLLSGAAAPRVTGADLRAVLDLRSDRPATAAASAPSPNPLYRDEPRLAPLLEPGSEATPAAFSHRRLLAVEQARDGLSEFRLSPGDLSVLRPDLGDLRIVDEDARQWPHRILERRTNEVLRQAVNVSANTNGSLTTVRLEASWSPLPVSAIELLTDKPFFDRPATVRGVLDDGTEVDLWEGRLRKQIGSSAPVLMHWESPGASRVRRVSVVIENGDDAPLAFSRAWFHLPTHTVQLIAKEGSYVMLLGQPRLQPPVYEALRARDLLLQNLRSGEIDASALEPNPAYEPSRRIAGALATPQPWFWVMVVVAAVFLVILTLRALRPGSHDEAL